MRCVIAAALAAVSLSAIPPAAADDAPCRAETFEAHHFTVCDADPKRTDVRLFLDRDDGSSYASLDALPADRLLFATNAGMFTPEYRPAGLYVDNGAETQPLNTRAAGYGNFHLQPNGVFWIADGAAHVSTTADYARQKPAARIATQSGPMLVISGAVNPKFDPDGQSRFVRNGVGVTADGKIAVAISEEPVSFGIFARFFRDALQCANALYLDGSVSRLLIPGQRRATTGPRLGPLMGFYRR